MFASEGGEEEEEEEEEEGWTAARCHRLLSLIERDISALRNLGGNVGEREGNRKGEWKGCGGCRSAEVEAERWSSPAGRGNKRVSSSVFGFGVS